MVVRHTRSFYIRGYSLVSHSLLCQIEHLHVAYDDGVAQNLRLADTQDRLIYEYIR